jgi:hypothetical protein
LFTPPALPSPQIIAAFVFFDVQDSASSVLWYLCGVLPPMYFPLRRRPSDAYYFGDNHYWLKYWIVFIVFSVLDKEIVAGMSWLPYNTPIKLAYLVSLW